MGLPNRIFKAAIAAIAAVAISPVIITAHASDDEGSNGGLPFNPPPELGLQNQTEFKMMMNYELGMHCTGFEFAYCCVLPAYNSILAQVIKPENRNNDFPRLLEADPNNNVASILQGGTGDVLGRHTVIRDPAQLDGNDNFQKYVLRYWHDAQPRNDGNGKEQLSTLISNVEPNSLFSWNTVADAADLNADGSFKLSGTKIADGSPCTDIELADPAANGCHPLYNGARNVVLGNGDFTDRDAVFTTGAAGAAVDTPIDNYQNVVWNHLYIYEVSAGGVEGEGGMPGGDRPEANKIRLGLHVGYPTNFGPAGHAMEGLLTYSGEHGTVVYTQMKVLEDLPITLTSPRIWEALGLPLTPFEDTIDFFGEPGAVDEDSIRPYVQMKAQLYHANCDANGNCTEGNAVLDRGGNPVIGFGTAPIDIPNCERCHSVINDETNFAPNSPNLAGTADAALVQQEMDYWLSVYPSMQSGSDWYARLKGAAISILARHDTEHGTSFTANYPATGTNPLGLPPEKLVFEQNTRLGHESVICQKCHADNVIAVVKSTNCGPGSNPLGRQDACADGGVIMPMSEAIHYNHREVSEGGPIDFADAEGRSGGCQGCHPAHRSDGDMAGYPIDLDGNNFYAGLDNRDANGGCFVGRDVHSNPLKDIDGAETPEHLNAVGQWLSDNVFSDQGANGDKGIWCTNCHSQAGQQIWKAENVADLVNARPGDPGHVREPSANATLSDVVAAVNAALGTNTSETTFIEWLDPGTHRAVDRTHAIWEPDPGLCNYVGGYFGLIPLDPAHDGTVATVEVNVSSATACSTGGGTGLIDCGAEIPGAPAFHICGSTDTDGDFNVSLLDFCTTPDCVAAAQATLPANSVAVPVPFSAATDGRDHWLSAGEPHCADCHAAPYVEQSGNINAFAPFNYPRKASLMRYSRGHQDITCQGCHESIHGLYPVTPTIDTTSYWQAASLNDDNTHGPLKCGTCHDTNSSGVWDEADDLRYNGVRIRNNLDAAISWMHTFTEEADPATSGFCTNCHEDELNNVSDDDEGWLEHAMEGRASRSAMDRVEIDKFGAVLGTTNPLNTVCRGCHGDESDAVQCTGSDGREWKEHLTEGRVAMSVWEQVSIDLTGSTCGWESKKVPPGMAGCTTQQWRGSRTLPLHFFARRAVAVYFGADDICQKLWHKTV